VSLYIAMGIISSVHMRPKPHWAGYGSE
jgi:hypothetical protein